MTVDDEAVEQTHMTLGEHLEELRRRLILALVGVLVILVITLYFGEDLVLWLQQPLHRVQRTAGLPAMTVGLSVTTGFAVYLQVSIVFAVIAGCPWVVYQAWKFVSAGLYAAERRVALLMMPLSAGMSLLGVGFAYYVMLPVCLAFLINFSVSYPQAGGVRPSMLDQMLALVAEYAGAQQPQTVDLPPTSAPRGPGVHLPILGTDPAEPSEGQIWLNATQGEMKVRLNGHTRTLTLATGSAMTPLIEVGEYMSFVLVVTIGVVVAFQLPLVMLLVGWSGVIDPANIGRLRRYCVFACFVAGAVLTPADPISMFVLALPLWGLFEFGLILMKYVYRSGRAARAAAEAEAQSAAATRDE